ncbi:MAG: hypothetical protein GTO02_12255 [Candidatus Dadabacteria bacterium]|nr:hypothetical protein [Candidatus Dadabacteria bacterium]
MISLYPYHSPLLRGYVLESPRYLVSGFFVYGHKKSYGAFETPIAFDLLN